MPVSKDADGNVVEKAVEGEYWSWDMGTWSNNRPIASGKAQGLADTKPVADNSTEGGRAKNRRVELAKQ